MSAPTHHSDVRTRVPEGGPAASEGWTSLEHIAKLAGVSPGTVSRVLNGKNKENRPAIARRSENIRRIANELGYRPNAAARSMSTGRFGHVALVTCGEEGFDWLPTQLLHGIHSGLARHRSRLILSDVPACRFGEVGFVPELLREVAVDGLLIHSDGQLPHTAFPFFEGQRPPCVWVNEKVPFRAVNPDEHDGARRAVELLVGRGHRRIGFFHFSPTRGFPRHYSRRERRHGFERAMRQFGLPADAIGSPPLPRGSPRYLTVDQRNAAVAAFLRRFPDLTAVVAYEIQEASTLFAVASELGKRVPRDLEIVGFHDNEITETLTIPVATAEIPFRQLGEVAVDLLTKAMAGDAEAASVAVPYGPIKGVQHLGGGA